MSRAFKGIAAAAVTIIIVAAVAWLSNLPYGGNGSGQAVLRFAWRAQVEPVENCRHLTPAELEQLPVHMRRPEVCEGAAPPYRLHLVLDGDTILNRLVRAAGAREDRPIYVFHELDLTPGRHHVRVGFARELADSLVTAHEAAETEEHELREGQRWFPLRVELDTTIPVTAGDASLVTYDDAARAFVVRAAP